MSDNTTTSFPKMGTEAARARAVSDMAPSLKFRPRGQSKGGSLPPATAGHRQGVQERLGAQYAPQMSIVAVNAPESRQEQRNVRLVPSAVGNRDFYLKRRYGQVMQ